MIFANKTSRDILLKKELDDIVKNGNFKFNLLHTISHKEEGWNGAIGHVSEEMITSTLPAPGNDTIILTCGSPAMCRDYLLPMLKKLGYSEENIFDF